MDQILSFRTRHTRVLKVYMSYFLKNMLKITLKMMKKIYKDIVLKKNAHRRYYHPKRQVDGSKLL